MNTYFYRVLVIILFFFQIPSLSSQPYRQITIPPGSTVGDGACDDANFDKNRRYSVTLYDSFTSSQVNSSKWRTTYPFGKPLDRTICQNGSYETQLYLDDCTGSCMPGQDPFTFSNSKLTIRAQYTNGPFNYSGIAGTSFCSNTTGQPFDLNFPISSGLLCSNRRDFVYGKFEVRCKFSKTDKLWPAFWMIGPEYEIDIFEFFNTLPRRGHRRLSTNLHTYNSNGLEFSNGEGFTIKDFTKSYNTFGLERTPDAIIWYLNGAEIRRVHRFLRNDQPISCGTVNQSNSTWLIEENLTYKNVPMDLRLNLAVQVIDNLSEIDLGTYPGTLDVDYIRVSERVGSCIITPGIITIGNECAVQNQTKYYKSKNIDGTNFDWSITSGNGQIIGSSSTSSLRVHFTTTGRNILKLKYFDNCENRLVTVYKTVDVVSTCSGGGGQPEPREQYQLNDNLGTTISINATNQNRDVLPHIQRGESNILVFPNPIVKSRTAALHIITSDNTTIESAWFCDVLGKMVEVVKTNFNIKNNSHEISLNEIERGNYFIIFKTTSGRLISRSILVN